MEHDDANGFGILSGPEPSPAEIKRREEIEQRRLAEEAAAAEREAALEAIYDALDAAMGPYLGKYLAAVNAKARISAAAKKDFEQFKTYCSAKWSIPLPHLPARPQTIAAFLVRESERGAAHVSRLAKNISTIHRAVGFADPTTDVLVQAVIQEIKDRKEPNDAHP